MNNSLKKFEVRVNHELGFFSFYTIEADNYYDAEREAKKIFINQFCGGRLGTDLESGKVFTLEAYTINK